MLDIKRIREDFEGVKARVEFRGKETSVLIT